MPDEDDARSHLDSVRAALRRAHDHGAPPDVIARYEAEVERVRAWIDAGAPTEPAQLADLDDESAEALVAWLESEARLGEVREFDEDGVEVGEARVAFPKWLKLRRDRKGADSGRRQREAGAKSPGRPWKPGYDPRTGREIPAPTPDELVRMVDDYRERGESVRYACKLLEDELGLTASTIRSRYLKSKKARSR